MSAPRFLVDENLSVLLPEVAHARGYEATHINHYGLRKSKDWDILKIVAEEDWILVTNNAFEFRGRYQRLEIHPGSRFPWCRREGAVLSVAPAHDAGAALYQARLNFKAITLPVLDEVIAKYPLMLISTPLKAAR